MLRYSAAQIGSTTPRIPIRFKIDDSATNNATVVPIRPGPSYVQLAAPKNEPDSTSKLESFIIPVSEVFGSSDTRRMAIWHSDAKLELDGVTDEAIEEQYPSPTRQAIQTANKLMDALASAMAPRPSIYPTAEGSIALFIKSGISGISIYIEPDARMNWYSVSGPHTFTCLDQIFSDESATHLLQHVASITSY